MVSISDVITIIVCVILGGIISGMLPNLLKLIKGQSKKDVLSCIVDIVSSVL